MGFNNNYNKKIRLLSMSLEIPVTHTLTHDRHNHAEWTIVHFKVMCLVAKPLMNRGEGRVDFVVIQTLLLFICKSLCYHAN